MFVVCPLYWGVNRKPIKRGSPLAGVYSFLARINKNRQESTEGELALLKKYVFTVGGVVETKEDIKELQGFLEKKRKAKEEKTPIRSGEEG